MNSKDNSNMKNEEQEVRDENENEFPETVMKDLTKENMKEVMTSRDNKFIYFYKGSAENINLE